MGLAAKVYICHLLLLEFQFISQCLFLEKSIPSGIVLIKNLVLLAQVFVDAKQAQVKLENPH
jgi:hypothetical protein